MRLLHAGHGDDARSTSWRGIRTRTRTKIREELEGNLCRCTGYQNIVRAVKQGAAAMAK